MREIILLLAAIITLTACHESLEDRAAREAAEYTAKYCPTPVSNYTRTDSVLFYKATRTYTYYCTLTDKMDDPSIINQYRQVLHDQILASIRQSTNIKAYKDAGFIFCYICHSQKNPRQVLYTDKFPPKEYQ